MSMMKYYLIFILRKLFCILRIFPIKKNRMFFYSFAGKEYSDSPKYIAEYMEMKYPHKFEIIWALKEPGRWKGLMNKGWKIVPYKSLGHFYYYATSKCIITNTGPFKVIPRRNGQEIINTWHGGGAYKKTGVDNPYKDKYLVLSNRDYGQKDVTLFLTSCKAFTQNVIRSAFLYKGKVLECGLPRNDVLLHADREALKGKICRRYGIEFGKKIILYAPTWRNYETIDMEKINANGVMEACAERFGGEWIFLYRGHNLSKGIDAHAYMHVHDVTGYEDMQELLCISDVLISDYSSCIWDFSLLKRPCFLFVPDVKQYEMVFDFYTPMERWGFSIAEGNEILQKKIAHFEWEKALQDIKRAHAYFGIQETGRAREKIMEYIWHITNNGSMKK